MIRSINAVFHLHRILLVAKYLPLLLIITGCIKITEVGQPEHVGHFTVQKFHEVSPTDHGNSEWDYFEIRYGYFFPSKISLPPYNETSFQSVIRLPFKTLTWLVVTDDGRSVLVQEKDGAPIIKPFSDDPIKGSIRQISTTLWYIPNFKRIRDYKEGEETIYNGGHIFDGTTLSFYSLPDQPPGENNQFVAISPDSQAVAWLRLKYSFDTSTETHSSEYSLVVSDAQGIVGLPLTAGDEFLKDNPLNTFNSKFTWKLNEERRWEVVSKFK